MKYVLASLLFLACGSASDSDRPPTPLEELVDDYEEGTITRPAFLSSIAELEDDGQPNLLAGRLTESRLLFARDEPYRIEDGFEVAPGAILVIEEGATIQITDEASVDIRGRLYAIATNENRIEISASAGEHYTDLILHSGPNQLVAVNLSRGARNIHIAHPFDTHTLIEQAEFESWVDLAIAQNDSSGLHVLNSRFGYNTPEEEVSGESIRSRNSGVIRVEGSSFSYRTGYRDVLDLQDCDPDRWPIVIGNTFDGGEDDAIDLDNCSAIVVGNRIHNFRPLDLGKQDAGVNGGGVTGDGEGSTPFIANNIIEGCFHGIGFKNGARPAIVNNTIIDSNIGITLYQSAEGNPMPAGLIYNNILANNVGWIDGGNNDIVLNGKWWPQYNQVDDLQASAEVRYNITATLASAYPGEGNSNEAPLLDSSSGLPRPAAGSPAIDSGLGLLELPDIDVELALSYLAFDFEGNARAVSGSELVKPDRGALESE